MKRGRFPQKAGRQDESRETHLSKVGPPARTVVKRIGPLLTRMRLTKFYPTPIKQRPVESGSVQVAVSEPPHPDLRQHQQPTRAVQIQH